MRPRASQVARIRFVETEEDVETYRPVLDALKATIRDRQEELVVDEDDGLSVLVHWPDSHHLPRQGVSNDSRGRFRFLPPPS